MLNGSYLSGSFLGGTEVASEAPQGAVMLPQTVPDAYITLPGGLVMQRQTFWILVAAVVAAGIVWYRSQKADE
jgi:hypothetical protein